MSQSTPPDRTPDQQESPTPRWVKIFWIIGVLVVLMIMFLLFSGGKHGPGRHLGSSDVGDARWSVSVACQPAS